MKATITRNGNAWWGTCLVEREPGDPKFRTSGWGSGESRLLYHLKKVLAAQGYDLVKKRMHKDGHLVDERQQYLRTRSPKSDGPAVYIYNSSWAVRGAEQDFNEDGRVLLEVVFDVFKGGGGR